MPKTSPSAGDSGFTLLEMMIVIGIISLLAALTVPGLLRARITANEVSAIGSLRVTAAAQKAYAATCGDGHYATSYPMLGATGPAGAPAFISDDLGQSPTPVKSGYAFALGPGLNSNPGPNDCNGNATVTGYYATAEPQSTMWTGTRAFATSGRSVIWEVTGGSAPTEPFGAPASPID